MYLANDGFAASNKMYIKVTRRKSLFCIGREAIDSTINKNLILYYVASACTTTLVTRCSVITLVARPQAVWRIPMNHKPDLKSIWLCSHGSTPQKRALSIALASKVLNSSDVELQKDSCVLVLLRKLSPTKLLTNIALSGSAERFQVLEQKEQGRKQLVVTTASPFHKKEP